MGGDDVMTHHRRLPTTTPPLARRRPLPSFVHGTAALPATRSNLLPAI